MSGDLALAWSRAILRTLVAGGVDRIVVSPGSRSTPLALAALETDGLAVEVVIDERAAAFAALGAARASGRPAATLCTSGSAAAHAHPAIVEACQAGIPLVVLTADRPWELQGCGASQTIDQTQMFGAHVRGSFALGLPEEAGDVARAMVHMVARAVALARGPIAGAVHVNIPFRKPLEPSRAHTIEMPSAPPAPMTTEIHASPAALDTLGRMIGRSRRGVLIAGPSTSPVAEGDARELAGVAAACGLSLLAESASGIRFACSGALGNVDAITKLPPPDLAIVAGLAPVSPALLEWCSQGTRVAVSPLPADPDARASETLPLGLRALSRALAGLSSVERDSAWHESLLRAEASGWAQVERLSAPGALNELQLVRALLDSMKRGSWLLAGNSRAVRDLDSFVAPADRGVRVLHQRGAAGIDGLIAGAFGASWASGGPGALLLGDVSFAHDLSSLALARRAAPPLVIVVADNAGGRIFDELPVARAPGVDMARLFHTAPEIDIAAICAGFRVRHRAVRVRGELGAALADAFAAPGATVVQVHVDPVSPRVALRAIGAAS